MTVLLVGLPERLQGLMQSVDFAAADLCETWPQVSGAGRYAAVDEVWSGLKLVIRKDRR